MNFETWAYLFDEHGRGECVKITNLSKEQAIEKAKWFVSNFHVYVAFVYKKCEWCYDHVTEIRKEDVQV